MRNLMISLLTAALVGVPVAAASAAETAVPSALSSAPITAQPAEKQWNLDRIDQATGRDGLFHRNATGKGVDVYVLDSGVWPGHDEFSGRVKPGYGVTGDPFDDCRNHGTSVASTIAGNTVGVAPGANIIPVKVLDCNGKGTAPWVIDGINWILNNHQAGVPAVANMSIIFDKSAAVDAAVQAMIDEGITVVAGAGNDTRDACERSPGHMETVLTIGSTTDADRPAASSNFGPCVDMYAPGFWIPVAYPGVANGFTVASGTSFATPLVSGAAALYLEHFPTASPAEVGAYLKKTASVGVIKDLPASTRFLRTGIVTDGNLPVTPLSGVSPASSSLVLGGFNALSAQVDSQLSASSYVNTRISGSDRFDTSAKISASVFPANTPHVYIASGENFADALAASALGGSSDTPVLLSAKGQLSPSVKAELRRLNPTRITLVGGLNTLSDSVFADATALFPGKVDRIAGIDRFDTTNKLVRDRFQQSQTLYIASGESFADALSASAVAGNKNAPLLLTGKMETPASVAATIAYLRPTRVVIVGGENAVSANSAAQVAAAANVRVERIAGADRYETMLGLVKELPKSSHVMVASGESFPDALAGGAAAASQGIPLLLSPTTGLTASTQAYLAR